MLPSAGMGPAAPWGDRASVLTEMVANESGSTLGEGP